MNMQASSNSTENLGFCRGKLLHFWGRGNWNSTLKQAKSCMLLLMNRSIRIPEISVVWLLLTNFCARCCMGQWRTCSLINNRKIKSTFAILEFL